MEQLELDINPGMTLISEYRGTHRNSEIWRRQDDKFDDWVAIGYEDKFTRASHPFTSEAESEKWAEQWVLAEELIFGKPKVD